MLDYNYQNDKGQITIRFKGDLTISDVSEIKEVFNRAIAESEYIIVNHDECDLFDLSYIQVLIAAFRTSKEWSKNFKVMNKENDNFKQLLKDTGFVLEDIFIN